MGTLPGREAASQNDLEQNDALLPLLFNFGLQQWFSIFVGATTSLVP
jgi:hypothetical protein